MRGAPIALDCSPALDCWPGGGPDGVVRTTPASDDDQGISLRVEDFAVGRFGAPLGVDALDIAILLNGVRLFRAARPGRVRSDQIPVLVGRTSLRPADRPDGISHARASAAPGGPAASAQRKYLPVVLCPRPVGQARRENTDFNRNT